MVHYEAMNDDEREDVRLEIAESWTRTRRRGLFASKVAERCHEFRHGNTHTHTHTHTKREREREREIEREREREGTDDSQFPDLQALKKDIFAPPG